MVKLVEIDEADFQAWKQMAIVEYFTERVRAGNDGPDSPDRSRSEFESLLPYGRLTRDNYIFSIVDEKLDDRKVGVLWYAADTPDLPPDTLFLYGIRIDEGMRGKGYGKATMLLLEQRAKELGKERIALHVFAHNQPARRLYEELGYKPTNIVMAKEL
jgi:RimJ/RimL family protein N-acetyltransferase